jgi:hypothetical protein
MKTRKKKFKKTFNVNLIKIHKSYTAQEISELFGMRKETVLLWHKKEGLPAIDNKTPYLFKGIILKEFIRNRQRQRKHKCKANELFCFKCQKPRESINNSVSVTILNEKELNIKGVCSVCNTKMNKKNVVKNLAELRKIYLIEQIAYKHLNVSCKGSGSISLKEDLKNE